MSNGAAGPAGFPAAPPRRRAKGLILNDLLVRRSGALIEAEVDGELIGLEAEKGLCFGFNGTATRIWALIEAPKRFSDLRDALLAEYEVDEETCTRELRAVLDELEADGLVALEPLDA
jgi:hypothetical protein